jgi:hypothetical protein
MATIDEAVDHSGPIETGGAIEAGPGVGKIELDLQIAAGDFRRRIFRRAKRCSRKARCEANSNHR